MHFRTCLAVLMLLLSALVPCASRADALYTITALPAAFNPSDINNAGQMAGVVYTGNAGPRAAIYTDGMVTDLGSIGATWSFASALNEAGAVAGNFDTADGASHAFYYLDGVMRDIGAANALGLNAAGDVVGQTYDAHGASGFLYHAGTMTDIGHLGTGISSLAAAINDSGQIVGTSDIDAALHAPSHPYLYDHGALVDLGTLAGREVNSAVIINNAGQVAGYGQAADGNMHAFLYEHGVMTDLGSFGGLDVTIGGMNQLGQIVGTGNTWDGPDVPFISSGGALVDLNTLIEPSAGWTITSALDINDHGQIIANACRAGQCSAVRLDLASAVPEPGTALLLAAGLLMLAGLARRQWHPFPSIFARWRLMMSVRTLLPALLLLPVLLAPRSSQADTRYAVEFLSERFTPTDINNSGQMSGFMSTDSGVNHMAIYSGGYVADFGAFFNGDSYGYAINDARMVTGVSFDADGAARAFQFDGGFVADLGAGTTGLGMNAQGDVVGQRYDGDGTWSAFLYQRGVGMTGLGRLGTGSTASAYDINDTGSIVGESNIDDQLHSPFHPFLYENAQLQDLGTLANLEINNAGAINNAGQIAGNSEAADGTQHAFLYEHGTLTDVGGFGGLYLNVGAINEHGAFVGTSWTPTGTIGYLYIDGVLVALNDLVDPASGWDITQATGINDSGQIAAIGCRDCLCGALRLDVITAVPEPAAAFLMLSGALLLLGMRRRAHNFRTGFRAWII